MQLTKFQFSALQNISPAIFIHKYNYIDMDRKYELFEETSANKDLHQVLNVMEFKNNTYEYVRKFGENYQNWCDRKDANPPSKLPKDSKTVRYIDVLCVIWNLLDIEKPFPVRSARVVKLRILKTHEIETNKNFFHMYKKFIKCLEYLKILIFELKNPKISKKKLIKIQKSQKKN